MITFACYGAHMHGGETGSIDIRHNMVGSPMVAPNSIRVAAEQHLMDQPAYVLDRARRDVGLGAIVERCEQRGWKLIATHVRTNHVHVIVTAEQLPERVMNDLKSYASRILNDNGFDTPDRKRWARHGSTRWLRNRVNVAAAVKYVNEKQGEPMAVYTSDADH